MEKYWIWFKLLVLSNERKIELLHKYEDIVVIFNLLKKYHKLDLLKRVDDIVKYNKENNINILSIQDKIYPYLLKNIANPPVILYYKGKKEILNSKCLTIFPGKNIDKYGIDLINYVCEQLKKDNITVVSRMEKSDKYIYNNNKNNIIVLSNGIRNDVKYNSGIILSEYEYDIKNSKKNMIERNRLLTGLSTESLIIQASHVDGLYYLIDYALQQGREIAVFPGDVFNVNNIHTNYLINQGVNVISRVSELLVYEQKQHTNNM